MQCDLSNPLKCDQTPAMTEREDLFSLMCLRVQSFTGDRHSDSMDQLADETRETVSESRVS